MVSLPYLRHLIYDPSHAPFYHLLISYSCYPDQADMGNTQDNQPPAPAPGQLLRAPARNPLPPAPPARYPPPPPAPQSRMTAHDVFHRLADPAMDYARQYLFQTPNLGNDARQRQVIADMYNEIAPIGSLTEAIEYLEAAYWNFGQALQDWQRVQRLERIIANGQALRQDTRNSRLDRSNARGGNHFQVSKLKLEVKKADDTTITGNFDRDNFDQNKPRDVLRLNRLRQDFLDREIGPLACPPQGKAGEWWHDLEKWEVERRYVLRDRHASGFPGWSEMADEHNRGFQNHRLPGNLIAPPVRKHNKITQHINRSALNKHKEKGQERHKFAQRDIDADHDKRRRMLEDAWKSGFSATKEDLDALDEEEMRAAAATLIEIGKDNLGGNPPDDESGESESDDGAEDGGDWGHFQD